MKDKKFELYVAEVIKKYSKILLLDNHTTEVGFGLENENSWMECKCHYPYLSIELRYGDSVVEVWKKDREKVRRIIIHELCHPITDPLYNKAIERHTTKGEIEDERERLTDYIANIVVKNHL